MIAPTVLHPPPSGLEVTKNHIVEPHKHAQGFHEPRRHRFHFMEKLRETCAVLDVLAAAHGLPVHVMCIIISTAIIPISAVSVVWDLLAAIQFQIPDLSTINTPGFLLFINFIAIPMSMYGYMMEYLMHERSPLAVIGFISVLINPILFGVRAMIEYKFDGFRGEEKLYFEAFSKDGQEAKFPIGLIRYQYGAPYSDSEEGQKIVKEMFG